MNLADRLLMPIGTPVVLVEDNGEVSFTHITTAPWELGGHWVIGVESKHGGYLITRITPNKPLVAANAKAAALLTDCLDFLPTEAEMRDEAGLNEGRASSSGVLGARVREFLGGVSQ